MNQNQYPPVFILSCERSGSTLLRYIVDTHSQIACPSHLYLGNLCESLNTTLTGSLAQTQPNLTESEKQQFVIDKTRHIISDLMNQYVTDKNKTIWCEKTPMNLDHLALLHRHFPEAKYICLYRHCMDVVQSSIQLSKFRFLPEHIPYVHRNPGSIINAMTENWLDKTARLLAFEQQYAEQCFRVRYEDIVTEPETTLGKLFVFLGLTLEHGLIEKVFHSPHDKGEGDGRATLSTKISQDSIGKGREVPKTGIADKFAREINHLLLALHYPDLTHYYAHPVSGQKDAQPNYNKTTALIKNQFETTLKNYRADYPELNGVWKVVITGPVTQSWILDFSNPEMQITNADTAADYTLSLSEGLLQEMLNKTRDAIEAFSQGEISVEGNPTPENMMNLAKLLLADV